MIAAGVHGNAWKHGHGRMPDGRSSPTYRSWQQMINRCTNQRSKAFRLYGARGISVCERWLKFEDFLADMAERPPGTSLDRIDNDGDYEPGNCRWATPKQQARNSRKVRMVTYRGETKPLTVWCEELGLNPRTIGQRFNRLRWSAEQAFTTPVARSNRLYSRWRKAA